MDVVTHGLAGALVVQAVRGRPGWLPITATVGGALFPDLDVVGRLWDPMAPITFHRTVTHSFIGGLVLAAGIAGILRWWFPHRRFLALMRFAYLGVLSHVALDVLTAFGTAVWWPLTLRRFGLGWLYVIDPVVTLLVVMGLLLTRRSIASRERVARSALVLVLAYALVAGVLSQAAETRWAEQLAEERITAGRLAVIPTFLTPWRWVGVAESEDALYRVTFHLGAPLIEPIGVFPKRPVEGSAELEALSPVGAFRAFARFPWLTVTTNGDLRRVEYRDLAFEDHPLGGPMTLGITVDRSGAVRGIDLGHKL